MDVTVYKPIIKQVLSQLKVPRNQREDMEQECYVALLSRQKDLNHPDHEARASVICRSRITDVRRKEGQFQTRYKSNPNIKFESLSDPRIMRLALEVEQTENTEIQDDKVWEAIDTLPEEYRETIHDVYVDGKTMKQVSKKLGISVEAVRWKRGRGVLLLKKYFEEE